MTPLAPRDRTPARHSGVSCCGPGAHRKRKDGFRWLRDSHAHHTPPSSAPQTCVGAHTRVRKRPARPPHPGVSPGCRKKGQFRSPSLGLTGVLAATRRRLSPASVRDLRPPRPPPDLPRVLRPDYCRIAFQQPVASSTAQFAWLGPPSPKVITRIVPGTRVRRLLVLLARPLAGSGAAVPHVFKILLWFAGTCFPTIVVYSCCCCCCCRRRRRHRQVA